MALTKGTNTYIELTEAKQYLEDMGIENPFDSDSEFEAYLKRASKLHDRFFGNRYIGVVQLSNQPMYWPRWVSFNIDSDGNIRDFSGIPIELGYSTTEMAVDLKNGFNPDKQPEPLLKKIKEKVDGAVERDREFAGSSVAGEDMFYKFKLILRPLLKKSVSVQMSRGA